MRSFGSWTATCISSHWVRGSGGVVFVDVVIIIIVVVAAVFVIDAVVLRFVVVVGVVVAVVVVVFRNGSFQHDLLSGPLTNIALALSLDSTFPERLGLDNFTIMGGAHHGKGNAGLSSEFNVYDLLLSSSSSSSSSSYFNHITISSFLTFRHADPESANICLEFMRRTTMVTYELTLTTDFGWDWHREKLEANLEGHAAAKLLFEVTKAYKRTIRFCVILLRHFGFVRSYISLV
jgi:hypothetical protein